MASGRSGYLSERPHRWCSRGAAFAAPSGLLSRMRRTVDGPVRVLQECDSRPSIWLCRIRLRRPQFCVNPRSPYSWATRDERVTRIETLLAEAKLPEGDRLALREQLAVLRDSSADPKTQKRQVAVLRALQKAAPDVWSAAKPVIVSIATDLMRRDLGATRLVAPREAARTFRRNIVIIARDKANLLLPQSWTLCRPQRFFQN